jgi:hypothetical protein
MGKNPEFLVEQLTYLSCFYSLTGLLNFSVMKLFSAHIIWGINIEDISTLQFEYSR